MDIPLGDGSTIFRQPHPLICLLLDFCLTSQAISHCPELICSLTSVYFFPHKVNEWPDELSEFLPIGRISLHDCFSGPLHIRQVGEQHFLLTSTYTFMAEAWPLYSLYMLFIRDPSCSPSYELRGPVSHMPNIRWAATILQQTAVGPTGLMTQ